MPKWVLHLTILLLLILAFAFRWETGPQKTTYYTTKIFKHDRWTGQTWVKTYDFASKITKEELSVIPLSAPIKPSYPISPDSPVNSSPSFAFDSSGTNVPNINKFREALAERDRRLLEWERQQQQAPEYQIALAEYDAANAEYKKNVSNYIDNQYLIRYGLSIAWGLLVLASFFWLFRAVKKERELVSGNYADSKPMIDNK